MPAKNYFSSPEQSLTKLAPDKGVIISIYFDFVFLVPDDYLQFDKFFGYKMSENIFLLTLFIHFTSSFINPIVYALRIPESRQSSDFFCFGSNAQQRKYKKS